MIVELKPVGDGLWRVLRSSWAPEFPKYQSRTRVDTRKGCAWVYSRLQSHLVDCLLSFFSKPEADSPLSAPSRSLEHWRLRTAPAPSVIPIAGKWAVPGAFSERRLPIVGVREVEARNRYIVGQGRACVAQTSSARRGKDNKGADADLRCHQPALPPGGGL